MNFIAFLQMLIHTYSKLVLLIQPSEVTYHSHVVLGVLYTTSTASILAPVMTVGGGMDAGVFLPLPQLAFH